MTLYVRPGQSGRAGKIERPEQIAGYVLQVTMNLLRNHRRAMLSAGKARGAAKLQESAERWRARRTRQSSGNRGQVKNVNRGMSSHVTAPSWCVFLPGMKKDKETICRDLGLSPLRFDKIPAPGSWALAQAARIRRT